MGWARGSSLAEDVWDLFRSKVPEQDKRRLAKKLIDLFENRDCDTIDEAETLCKDAGRKVEED